MGATLAARPRGVSDFVAIDMGGTSFDICLVRHGRAEIKTDWNWRYRYYIGLPMVDVQSVGAGGGSIARVRQGALLVGPESAGALPGPVCYGTRRRPTHRHRRRRGPRLPPRPTDSREGACNSTSRPRAGRSSSTSPSRSVSTSPPRRGASSASSTRTWRTRPARCSPATAPTPATSRSSRTAATGRCTRPRSRASSAIDRILVPKVAPAFCALGVLVADYVVDLVRSYVTPLSQVDLGRVRTLMSDLEARGRQGARAGRAPGRRRRHARCSRRCATRARTST